MSGHTPGPWHVEEGRAWESKRYVMDAGNLPVAVPHGSDMEEWRANAHLIAAAPDLLKALEDLESCQRETAVTAFHERFDAAIQRARTAIAKARGEA